MKALSVHPYFAAGIFTGQKTIECRTWETNYRGDIVICSTAKKVKDTIPGHALCVVKLANIRPFLKSDCEAAMMPQKDFQPGLFAWELDDLRIIRPIPVKGKLSLWEFKEEIEILQAPETDEEDEKMYHEIWEPLFI